jgi:hypothetical protein
MNRNGRIGPNATPSPKPKSAGKRSETVSLRLDPTRRFLAEVAAHSQRRSLSSFIDQAVEEALIRIYLVDARAAGKAVPSSMSELSAELWDPDEAIRFAKLAFEYPELLDHHQQLVWRLIRERGHFWKGHQDPTTGEWIWSPKKGRLSFERLRKYWDTFNQVARGEAPRSEIPPTPRNGHAARIAAERWLNELEEEEPEPDWEDPNLEETAAREAEGNAAPGLNRNS